MRPIQATTGDAVTVANCIPGLRPVLSNLLPDVSVQLLWRRSSVEVFLRSCDAHSFRCSSTLFLYICLFLCDSVFLSASICHQCIFISSLTVPLSVPNIPILYRPLQYRSSRFTSVFMNQVTTMRVISPKIAAPLPRDNWSPVSVPRRRGSFLLYESLQSAVAVTKKSCLISAITRNSTDSTVAHSTAI